MVTARLISGPMSFNETQVGGPASHFGPTGATPAPAEEGAVGQLYRTLARTYAGEFQRHQIRRKRIIAGVAALGVISFLGLLALSYWGSI
jgi:hypothetical protein